MRKITFAAIWALVLSLPAWAGYYRMVDHLPNYGGVESAAVSFYHDASSATNGIAVIGGTMPGGATDTASHYQFGNGWTGLPLLPYSLTGAAAASVGDTVYCHGGFDSDGSRINNRLMKFAQYIYNWDTLAGYSLSPRMNHGLVKLYDQHLYAVGGTIDGINSDSTVERLDPLGGPPLYVKAMPQGRRSAVVATAIGADGKPHIYVIGGWTQISSLLNSVIEYDSTGYPGTWTTRASMPGPARAEAAGAVVNNKIYVMGGVVDMSGTTTRRVDIFDPQTNTWSLGDSLPEPLRRAGATGYGELIYIFGGHNANTGQLSDSVWAYHPLAPNPPLLVSPPANAAINNTSVDFVWRSVPDAGRYRIQVSSDPDFYTIDILNHMTATNTDTVVGGVGVSSQGDYYWRVMSYNHALSDSSLWSPVRKLTVDTDPPDQPIPSTPSGGAYLNNYIVDFSWSAVDGAHSYHLQVADEPAFAGVVNNTYNIIATGISIDLSSYGEGTYYWRVEARDTAGNWSGWHSIQSFTMDVTKPYAIYTDPFNGENNVPADMTVIIAFSEPIKTGTMNFNCSPDPGGWSEWWSATNDTVWLAHNNFTPLTNYSLTVNASDEAGNMFASSYAWGFVTVQNDVTPPTIGVPETNFAPLYAGTNGEFSVSISDDKAVQYAYLDWMPAGSLTTAPEQIPLGYNSMLGRYTAFLHGSKIYPRGVQYRVTASDSAGNIATWPASGEYYIHSVRFTNDLQTTLVTDQWQMISVPTDAISQNMFNMLSSELGSYDKTKWRLFVWQNGSYKELADPSNYLSTIHKLGQAFWIRDRVSEDYVSFEQPDSSVGGFLSSDGLLLSLDPGWNDVGNPFMFPIGWMSVDIPGMVAGPYFYDPMQKRWMNPAEVTSDLTMQPYKGYSFRNDNSFSVNLTVYPHAAYKGQTKKAPLVPDSWQALARIESGEGADHNYFGTSSDASGLRDRYDYPEPPAGLSGASGYFQLDGDRFCTDIRPAIGQGQSWVLAVDCNGPTKLSISLPPELPAGTECHLADLTRRVSQEVRGDLSYCFVPVPGEQTREFRIAVGSREYAQSVLGEAFALPSATLLGQNLPNPFSGKTAISYQLAAGGQVKIAVYNVAGRLVRTLVDQAQPSGRYSVTWDGRDQAGRQAPAGVYLYRLQAPERTATRRMTLVR